MYPALAMLLLCSCTKIDILAPQLKAAPLTGEASYTPGVQNLGRAFTGSNIAWKIHPHDPNNAPLFTKGPNNAEGFYMVMIDNGPQMALTPVTALRFVAINLQNQTSKIVEVNRANGTPATSSLGRIVRYVFGMDKKFYLATEGAAGGGGHLIQYDPGKQQATDLGKPFQLNNKFLDVYTLQIGTDGALYAGSFGGSGEARTLRYDYTNMVVDNAPLDNSSRYVTALSGDNRYTYVVGGKNNWFLYAIDRQTGEKRTLKTNAGSSSSISLASHTDGVYMQSHDMTYKLSGFSFQPLPPAHRPMTNRVEYVPYSTTDSRLPKVSWDNSTKTLSYSLPGGHAASLQVNGLHEDVFPINGPMLYANNRLYISSAHKGILGTYTPGDGIKTIGGTSMELHAMTAPYIPSADAGSLFLGGYPKGQILQYKPHFDWTVSIQSAYTAGNGFATSSTNPQLAGLFQNADASGTNGSMILLGSTFTKNGYLVSAGNNDRITASSGRELSIGSMKNGVIRNLYLPDFSNYQFRSLTLSYDSNYAFIVGIPNTGATSRIFKYDPSTNTVVDKWDLPLWGDRYTTVAMLSSDILVGICDESIYLFSLTKREIIWSKSIGVGKKIHSIAVAPDKSAYIIQPKNSPTQYLVSRFNFDLGTADVKATETSIAEFSDGDSDERYKPSSMLVAATGSETNLFIGGLLSLYKIRL